MILCHFVLFGAQMGPEWGLRGPSHQREDFALSCSLQLVCGRRIGRKAGGGQSATTDTAGGCGPGPWGLFEQQDQLLPTAIPGGINAYDRQSVRLGIESGNLGDDTDSCPHHASRRANDASRSAYHGCACRNHASTGRKYASTGSNHGGSSGSELQCQHVGSGARHGWKRDGQRDEQPAQYCDHREGPLQVHNVNVHGLHGCLRSWRRHVQHRASHLGLHGVRLCHGRASGMLNELYASIGAVRHTSFEGHRPGSAAVDGSDGKGPLSSLNGVLSSHVVPVRRGWF